MHTLRLALRRLARQPGFTLLAVFTLAVGLGASAAVFSVVDAVLIRPLDYPEPEGLVAVSHRAPGLGLEELDMSQRLYVHYREHAASLAQIGLYDSGPASVSGLERPIQASGATVTPSVFEMLGAVPNLGRIFTGEEGEPGAAPSVVISELFWRRQLAADPDVLERSIEVDGVSRRIVGVLPGSFDFPRPDLDLWLPQVVDAETAALGAFRSQGVARLREGVDVEQARADLERFAGDLVGLFPGDEASKILADAGFQVSLRPLRDAVVGDVGSVLWVLLATVGFVLLLATVNVANLFLARAEQRRRETAIRSALGAGRGALVRASLGEGLLLALVSGILGAALGHFALRALLRLTPGELPRLHEVALDGRVLIAVAVLAACSGLVFGALPLVRSRLGALASQLKDGGRSATLGRDRHRVRRALVAVQMAIAVVLLIGAGLMVRSFQGLARVDPGFETADRLSFRLSLPDSKVEHDADGARFFAAVQERLAALPGVHAVASTSGLPLSGRTSGAGHRIRDEVERGEGAMPTVFEIQHVSPGYFETLGIPILEGRPLERSDFETRSGAVVVSRSLAREKWPGENAVGKRIFPGRPTEDQPWMEVVGVAGDVRVSSLAGEERPVVYYPWLTPVEDLWKISQQTIVLHASGDRARLMDAVRDAVWALDGDLPLAEVETLGALVSKARARTAFTAVMLLLAAAVALLLGAVGTYGVISFLVAERRGEIGVRLALGARRQDVLGLVLREGLLLAAAGAAVGLVAAAALTRLLRAVLYDVTPHDPFTFAAVPVVLVAVAACASLLPARRASQVDPVVALRAD